MESIFDLETGAVLQTAERRSDWAMRSLRRSEMRAISPPRRSSARAC